MFEDLDDREPPIFDEMRRAVVVERAHRFIRRRRAVRGGIVTGLAVVAIVGVVVLRNGEDTKVTVAGKPKTASLALARVLEQGIPPCAHGFVAQQRNGTDVACYRLGPVAMRIGRADVRRAVLTRDSSAGNWKLDLTLTAPAARLLDRVAGENVGSQVAVSAEGTVLIAPMVDAPEFNGRMQISVDDQSTADRLGTALGAVNGRVPVSTSPVGISVDTIPEGTSVQRLGGHSVFVVRRGDTFTAFLPDARHLPEETTLWWCPHERQFASPTHGEFFSEDGLALGGPARGNLNRLAVDVRRGRLVSTNKIIIGEDRPGNLAGPSDGGQPWDSGPTTYCAGALKLIG